MSSGARSPWVATCLFPGCVLSCMRQPSSVTITSGRLDSRYAPGHREISLAFNVGGRAKAGTDVTSHAEHTSCVVAG